MKIATDNPIDNLLFADMMNRKTAEKIASRFIGCAGGDFYHPECPFLLNEGLIMLDKIIITPDGKKFSLHHTTLKSINVKYEDIMLL